MPKGIQGMINLNSNMVAPQVSSDNNGDASNWKIVKSKRQLREEKKSKYHLNFPPLPSVSSQGSKPLKKRTKSVKTEKSTDSDQTPSKGASSKIRKIAPSVDEIKTIKVPRVTQESEDDMSTVSSSSYEGFFSSSDSSEEEGDDSSTHSHKNEDKSRKITSNNNNDLKNYDEDVELDKIIAKIEREHISTVYDNHLQPKRDTHKETSTLNPHIKIKREDDHGIEVALSVRAVQANDHEPSQFTTDSISQAELKEIYDETEMIADIAESKETINFCIKEEETDPRDLTIIDIAMDLSHIRNNIDYTNFIKNKLPRLHDQIIPSSLREIAFLGQMLRPFMSDWSVDSLERGLELERIEESMFFNQLKMHGMDNSFKKLYEELHLIWDEYGIPYNKRRKLLLVEIEMVSLLMCDVLPCNYTEQGIWLNDESQGQYYQFFKDKIVDTGRKKWLDLLSMSTYEWFWKVYAGSISITSLQDIDFVTLHDIFEIVSFIHPRAVQILLRNSTMQKKYMFIKEKATNEKSWVETRHSLFYVWYFFGYRTLPKDYPSYDPTGDGDVLNSTKWISKLMSY